MLAWSKPIPLAGGPGARSSVDTPVPALVTACLRLAQDPGAGQPAGNASANSTGPEPTGPAIARQGGDEPASCHLGDPTAAAALDAPRPHAQDDGHAVESPADPASAAPVDPPQETRPPDGKHANDAGTEEPRSAVATDSPTGPAPPIATETAAHAHGRTESAGREPDPAASGAQPQLATETPASMSLAVAPAAPLDASALTPVTPPTASTVLTGNADRAQAMATVVSAVNHTIIQREASGHIELPDLGRIAVRASSVGGRVDVEVASDRAETHAVLHASAGALAADLRQADIPLGRLRFNEGAAGSATGDSTRRDAGTNDTPRKREPIDAQTDDPPVEDGAVTSVRIVL